MNMHSEQMVIVHCACSLVMCSIGPGHVAPEGSMRLGSTKRGKQLGNNGDESGTKYDDEYPRKNEEYHWNHHLDRQFGCLFFCALSAPGSKRI